MRLRPIVLTAVVVTLAGAPAAHAAWRTVTFDHTVQAADRMALDRAGGLGVHPSGARSYLAFMDRAAAERLADRAAVARVRVADKVDAAVLRGATRAQVVRLAGGRRVTEVVALGDPSVLARRVDVLSVGPAPAGLFPEDEGTSQLLAGNHTAGVPTPGYLAWLGAAKVDGSGVKVAIVDTGVDPGHPDLDDRIAEEVNYDPDQPPSGEVDEQGHGTHVAGIVAGRPDVGAPTAFADLDGLLYGQGVAPGAELVAMNALGLLTTADTSRLALLIPRVARDAARAGAVGWNASWHTGEGTGAGYLDTVRLVDGLVRDADPGMPGAQPFTMVFSAGNAGSGEKTLTVPHEAKNIISVASSLGQRAGETSGISSFSSRGPTVDGRIAPTVTAPGEVVSSARAAPFGGLCFEPADVSPIHSTCSGTSMAAPHVTGAVALATQWWKGFNGGAVPSPAMHKALLVNTTSDLGDRDVPNFDEGWGRVNLGTLFGAPAGSRVYSDQKRVFVEPGEQDTLRVRAADPAKPLRVTLAWTDAPGATAVTDEDKERPALINDLDLTVSAAGGTAYLGNHFKGGHSVAGGAANRLDNLENVWLDTAGEGPYTVTVRAAALPGEGVPGDADTTDQDYALVVSNGEVVLEPAPVPAVPVVVTKPAPLARAVWGKRGRRTVLKRLVLPSVPAGATVSVRCSGTGCGRKRTLTRRFAKAARNVSLGSFLNKARLSKGARVTVSLTAPGAARRVSTWVMTSRPGRPRAKLG